jgi:hypothetical protein
MFSWRALIFLLLGFTYVFLAESVMTQSSQEGPSYYRIGQPRQPNGVALHLCQAFMSPFDLHVLPKCPANLRNACVQLFDRKIQLL